MLVTFALVGMQLLVLGARQLVAEQRDAAVHNARVACHVLAHFFQVVHHVVLDHEHVLLELVEVVLGDLHRLAVIVQQEAFGHSLQHRLKRPKKLNK